MARKITPARARKGNSRGRQFKAAQPSTLAWQEIAWDFAIQGLSIRAIVNQIAKEHGRRVSTGTVHKWLTAAANRAMKTLDERIVQYKAQQIDVLRGIHFEAAVAWEKSKTGRHATQRKRTTPLLPQAADGAIPTPVQDVVTTTTEPSPGNPKFLAVMLAANADIRRLLGLDAPIKVEALR